MEQDYNEERQQNSQSLPCLGTPESPSLLNPALRISWQDRLGRFAEAARRHRASLRGSVVFMFLMASMLRAPDPTFPCCFADGGGSTTMDLDTFALDRIQSKVLVPLHILYFTTFTYSSKSFTLTSVCLLPFLAYEGRLHVEAPCQSLRSLIMGPSEPLERTAFSTHCDEQCVLQSPSSAQALPNCEDSGLYPWGSTKDSSYADCGRFPDLILESSGEGLYLHGKAARPHAEGLDRRAA